MLELIDKVPLSEIVVIRDQLLEKQRKGEKVYRLESGTPSFNVHPKVKEAMKRAIDENKTFYTEGSGIEPLKQVIAEKLARKNNLKAKSTKNILVGQGGMGTLYMLIHSLVGPGDKILIQAPVWISIKNISMLTGAEIIELPTKKELDFNWDLNELEDTIKKEKPKAVVYVNPGNPTGGVGDKEYMHKLAGILEKYGVFLVEDVAYEDIVYPGVEYETIFYLNPELFFPSFSMSKSQAFSGLRIGYTYIENDKILTRARKLLLYTTNGVNSVAQWGATEALKPEYDEYTREMVKEYQKRRDILYKALTSIPFFKMEWPPRGAFYLFPEIDEAKYREVMEKKGVKVEPGANLGVHLQRYLLEHNIGSIPGHNFGSPTNFIRFAYSIATEFIEEAAEKLKEVLG